MFALQHNHATADGLEDVKFIGVYSSRERAETEITRLGGAPGFADALAGFHIDEYRLDQDQWVEGYVSLQDV